MCVVFLVLGGRQHECVFRWVSNMYTYVEHHLERSFVCRCLVTVIGPRAFSCTCVRLTYLKVPTLESLIGPTAGRYGRALPGGGARPSCAR